MILLFLMGIFFFVLANSLIRTWGKNGDGSDFILGGTSDSPLDRMVLVI